MAEIVNLRRVKKALRREAEAEQAAANRVRFGAPKPVRAAAEAERKALARAVDQAKLSD